MKKIQLYIITFIGVAATILIIGYFGMNVALDFMQQKYIEMQLDVNKRQASTMAKILEAQVKISDNKALVRQKFQEAIQGTQADKGFLCMFNNKTSELACHPDKNKVGMKIDDKFTFDNVISGKKDKTKNELARRVELAGLFHKPNGTDIAYMVPVKGTDWTLAAHENIKQIYAEIEHQREIFRIGFFVLSFITAIIATLMARLVGRKYEKTIEKQNIRLGNANEELKVLNEELNQQKEEILAQNEEIEKQKNIALTQRDEITVQNEEITASILYAKRIQTALLPPAKLIELSLPQHFIYFLPKDIVSGDFYWFKKIGDTVIFAAADCTGHGVPGAFMSMLGISFLNEIISEETKMDASCSTDIILNRLRDKVKTALRQNEENTKTKDGMDIAIFSLNTKTLELQYAGAYNPLLIIRNNELTEVHADRMPVGVYRKEEKTFTKNKIQLQIGDILYVYSDGFQDQFGGPLGRKFMAKNFRKFLHKNSHLPLPEQHQLISDTYKNWKGNLEQVDDVLVAGFKIGK